ncbi:hypothetical protein PMALA_050680 [Plasmodium malariae]|uniref:Uncharacterized protein n=1 Tax=Plasmodium malariae TaxID=5858 RepID=A0A1A8WVY3_PLAMA|nr:hypothetical protein PMALA_050680 [Plasmodium malariae]
MLHCTATGRWNNKLFPGGDEKFCILYKQIDKKDDKCSRQDIDFVPENSLLTESGDIRSGERVYTDELPATKETIKAHSKGIEDNSSKTQAEYILSRKTQEDTSSSPSASNV